MTDIKLLALLNDYYNVQRNVVTYMLWAMEDFERGREDVSWVHLFDWCEAKDERADAQAQRTEEKETSEMSGLQLAKIDRYGPAYTLKSVINTVASEVNQPNGSYITRGAKTVTTDMQKATDTLADAERVFSTAVDRYQAQTAALSAAAKKCSGDVRKAADDLASGLAKVEKTANFANLERYVGLLERAATAMQTLAELEKSGRLDKIAGALK